MNGDADSSEVTNGEGSEGQGGQQAVDIDAIEDADQLRAILQNPAGFTEKTEEASAEGGEGEQEEAKSEEEEAGTEGSGAAESGDETETEEAEGDEGQEGAKGEKPEKQRVKIRAGHLDDVQRDVLKLVSRKKISLPDAQDEVFRGLVKGGKSEAEAGKLVYGGKAKATKSEADEEGARVPSGGIRPAAENTRKGEGQNEEGSEGQVDAIGDTQKEIDAISEKLAAARKDYNFDEVEKLRDQRDELKDKLRDLKAEAKSSEATKVQTKAQEFTAAVDASSVEAIELFPDAANEGTELFEAIAEAVEDRKKSDPDFFNKPNWPKTLAAECAAELGIPSTKHKAGAKPAQGEKRAVPPKKKATVITPASGASGGQQQSAAELTAEQELEAAGDDPDKIKAVMRKHGSRSLPIGMAA